MRFPSVTRRSAAIRSLGVALAVTLGLAACEPGPPVPPPGPAPTYSPVPAPAGASLSLSTDTAARLSTVEVAYSGCDGDFQYLEARLVAGSGSSRTSLAVTTAVGDPAELTVPAWVADGPITVEGSCLEPDFSGVSDGSDVHRFDFAPLALTVAGGPAPVSAPSMNVSSVVSDGSLDVSGSGCGGRVLVAVAASADRVASAARFHYGRTLITADASGSWSASIPLDYRVGTVTDPAAPGAMTAFATCEGWAYQPASFRVAPGSPAPAIHPVGTDGSQVIVTQCPGYNTLRLVALVRRPSGAEVGFTHEGVGPGYGEHVFSFSPSADVTEIQWYASCDGLEPSFTYQPYTWFAP